MLFLPELLCYFLPIHCWLTMKLYLMSIMYYNINIIKYKLDFKLHCFVCTQANSGSFCCALISEDLHAVNYLILD